MTVQTLTRPIADESSDIFVAAPGLDLDAIDHALDRGDLETARRLLGIRPDAWQLLLSRL